METRFMQVMYSATQEGDAELTNQVGADVEAVKNSETGNSFETDEVTYVNLGSGKVLVIDKENGESTVIEEDPEDAENYTLEGYENPDVALEKYLHPEADGVTPNENVQTEVTENVEENHLGGEEIANAVEEKTVEETAREGVCPECGNDPCTCGEEEQHEFSNIAMSKLFSDADFYCRLFSEVVSEGKPAVIGDLKFEISEEDPETVIVTDVESGDAAQVSVDENGEAIVNELQKECSEEEEQPANEEQYEPMYVVGINGDTSELVDAPVYTEEDAQDLAQRLTEIGIEGVEIFEDQEEARAHAAELLGELDITELEEHAEPEEKEFSDYIVYTTRYFSNQEIEKYYSETVSSFMEHMFSEEEEEITDSQEAIEDAIKNGEQVEDNGYVITPVDGETAIVADKDNNEYTKVVLEGDELDMTKISEETADELTKDLEVGEEKKFSEYEVRLALYSEDVEAVTKAIEEGEKVDNETETITPVDENTAIVFDKENEEYTKVTLDENKELDSEAITEEAAKEEIKDEANAEEEAPAEEPAKETEEEDKTFSFVNKYFADAVVDPNTGDPVEEVAAPTEGEAPATEVSVEGIEDKALEAVQSIQEAANNAVLAIQEAKEAPAPGEEEDIKEAHFSDNNEVINNWLNNL